MYFINNRTKVRIFKSLVTLFIVIICLGAYGQKDLLKYDDEIICGADKIEEYLPLLKDKSVALVANQTSVIGGVHIVDTLLSLGVVIKKVFALEHGFRGDADAGEFIDNTTDQKTGLPLVSLHGKKNRKPSAESLKDVDVILFDIQDVGLRFYTYISSLHYIIEAAAENGTKVIVLDRPNPNGHFIDGPVLKSDYTSFVGMHPVPVVYGMTIGEYGKMIIGEGWTETEMKCDYAVIPCGNYEHNDYYKLPVKPSPNLPNMGSIYLYPTLCFFEGTKVSVGRGTPNPFQLFGYPGFNKGDFEFTPVSTPGASKYPKHENQKCTGFSLVNYGELYARYLNKINLEWIIGMYSNSDEKDDFFREDGFFNLLSGNGDLMQQIKDGVSEEDIRETWLKDLGTFKNIRKKYLIYPDFTRK